jgi:hypothetical protein
MKKLIFILICFAIMLPLYAQEQVFNEETIAPENGHVDEHPQYYDYDFTDGEEGEYEESESEHKEKKGLSFARRHFEFGIDMGVGFDNDLIMVSDILQKELVIDLNKIGDRVREQGFNINLDIPVGLFLNLMNFNIGQGIWDFGFAFGVDGNINLNIPKSFFTLISEGNSGNRNLNGMVSAAGGIYAYVDIPVHAQYNVAEKRLRVGVTPALFTPLVFVPRSGIDYSIKTKDEDIIIKTSGAINVYSPFMIGDGQSPEMNMGLDISLDGEYSLFSFLDVGGSLSRIPFGGAKVKNRMRYTMEMADIHFSDHNLLEGDAPEKPDMKMEQSYDTSEMTVYRPLRFDLYARWKVFSTEFLVVKPNIGFSVDINDNYGFFNIGVEGQLNLMDFFIVRLGTGLCEDIWEHKLGLILNLRAFELGLGGSLRSQDFAGSFSAQGFGVNVGLRFGW